MDTPDPLNDQLADLADAIAVDDPQMSLRSVRTTAARRSRRRNVLGGAAAVAALVGGVLVVGGVTGNDDTESMAIDGAQAETPTTDEATGPDEGGTGEPADGTDGTTTEATAPVPPSVPSITSTRVETIVANPTSISIGGEPDAAESDIEWIVPWQDGFLASRFSYTPQPLPAELPAEIAALFSQEVLDLFADGLPPTIEEATTMLSAAGLLDEVTTVLSEHPEASEAVYSAGSPQGSSSDVVFSSDGVDWEPIEFTTPEGTFGLYGVQSTGTRLAVATQALSSDSEPDEWGSGNQVGDIIVATTTDLINWDITTIDVGERPADLPAVFGYEVSPGSLAINDDQWVLPISIYSDIEIMSLLPDDVRDRVQRSSGGFSSGWDDDGVTIEIIDGSMAEPIPQSADESGDEPEYQPTVSETFTFTWAELGVDPQDLDAGTDRPDSQLFASTWGGEPVPVEGVNAWSVAAGGDGFYSVDGVSLGYSSDGVNWVTLDGPTDELYINMVKSVPSGALLFVIGPRGATQVLRVSGSGGTWELLEIPGAPTAFSDGFGNGSSTPAMIAQGSEPQEVEPTEITIETDGYTLAMREDGRLMTVTVTDADGTVVADETRGGMSNDEPTTWRYGRSGLEILDPESSEVIVTFDRAAMETAYREQTDRYDNLGGGDQYDHDHWLIATLTGDRWLVEDLNVPMDIERFRPGLLAVNGSTLIVNGGDGWQLYDLS